MAASPTDNHEGGDARLAQLEAIVNQHEAALLRYATRILNDAAIAQDVVQAVFMKLCTAWRPGFRPGPQLRGWLYRTTHNEAVDHIRHESRLRLLHERHAESTATCSGNGDCPGHDRREAVLAHLRRLHPREQQVVLLRLQEGLSYEEIGRVTGRSSGNVGKILHHAVRRLARSLKAAEGRP